MEKGSGAGRGLRNETNAVSATRVCAGMPASWRTREPVPSAPTTRSAGTSLWPSGPVRRTPTTRSPSRSRSTSSCSHSTSTPSRRASSTVWRATEMATGWSLRCGGMSMPWARTGPSTPISSRAS